MPPDQVEASAPEYAAERIRLTMGELPAAERRVARALLSEYPTAGLEPIAQLADRAGVSAPTVTRYIARLGYAGFREFQQSLRGELQARTASPMSTAPKYRAKTAPAGVLEDTASVGADLLITSFRALPPSEFDMAVELLATPRLRITSVGGRFSHVLAELLDLHLRMMRPNTQWRLASVEAITMVRVESDRHDAFAVFDFRRYQRDVVNLARVAHDRGAKIVLITDAWLSPIAEFAEVVLPLRTDNASGDSLVPAVALVEALATATFARLGQAAEARVASLDHDFGGMT